MTEHTGLLSADLSRLYDSHYFRTYNGAPYERSALWLTLFNAIADGVVREIRPQSVLDVGCAMGFLVETLRDRGVEAFGLDVSQYAIERVRDDIRPHCWVASATEPLPRKYDLIVCHEVLEHLPAAEAEAAIERMCEATDDILFSSTPSNYGEDTHVNVRPPEHWAALFADRGFIRDVDFNSAAFLSPWSLRLRRSLELLPRVVGDYERRLSTLSQENAALRTRALETKALLARQDEVRSAAHETQALERTVAEQRDHLDALTDRLRYLSDRETQLRTMLHSAHQQLLARDELLRARPVVPSTDELYKVIAERTEWAERVVAAAEERGKIIDEQQAALTQRQAAIDAQQATIGEQQAAIAELYRVIDERTAWAERMVAEAESRGRIIEELTAPRPAMPPSTISGRAKRVLRRLRKSA